MPPAKGLRGVLDSIVSDGMRVAGEVRKRVDEAQRELERSATVRSGGAQDDEDEDDDLIGRPSNGSFGGRSVRDHDRDLLEGAEAVVGGGGSAGAGKSLEDEVRAGGAGSAVKGQVGKVVEFERTRAM